MLLSKSIKNLNYEYIEKFIKLQFSESISLEYKREIKGNVEDKKEISKDVSAMANSQGSHIS